MTLDDYQQLPIFDSFPDIFNETSFTRVPGNWHVIVCDIERSTTAVRNGQYKEVNMAAAAAVSVAGNILGHLDFPFTFGGDGISAVLPEKVAGAVLGALVDLQATVRQVYGLHLRIGSIAVQNLPSGTDLFFARLRVGNRFIQAVFAGEGVLEAERLLKQGKLEDSVLGLSGTANMSGISCRWKDIPSRSGETYTLIVQPLADNLPERFETIRRLWKEIAVILGREDLYHPVQNGIQRMINSQKEASREAVLHGGSKKGFKYHLAMIRVRFEAVMAGLIIFLKIPLRMNGKYLPGIPQDNIVHADFRKFDGQLKAVFACNSKQREQLDLLLQDFRENNLITFGRHISDRSVITCLIHVNADQEVHFIDGGDGGYTLAAAQMKDCL
ncbi:DUF3095 family protein [Spirochaeta dissipatitropha]